METIDALQHHDLREKHLKKNEEACIEKVSIIVKKLHRQTIRYFYIRRNISALCEKVEVQHAKIGKAKVDSPSHSNVHSEDTIFPAQSRLEIRQIFDDLTWEEERLHHLMNIIIRCRNYLQQLVANYELHNNEDLDMMKIPYWQNSILSNGEQFKTLLSLHIENIEWCKFYKMNIFQWIEENSQSFFSLNTIMTVLKSKEFWSDLQIRFLKLRQNDRNIYTQNRNENELRKIVENLLSEMDDIYSCTIETSYHCKVGKEILHALYAALDGAVDTTNVLIKMDNLHKITTDTFKNDAEFKDVDDSARFNQWRSAIRKAKVYLKKPVVGLSSENVLKAADAKNIKRKKAKAAKHATKTKYKRTQNRKKNDAKGIAQTNNFINSRNETDTKNFNSSAMRSNFSVPNYFALDIDDTSKDVIEALSCCLGDIDMEYYKAMWQYDVLKLLTRDLSFDDWKATKLNMNKLRKFESDPFISIINKAKFVKWLSSITKNAVINEENGNTVMDAVYVSPDEKSIANVSPILDVDDRVPNVNQNENKTKKVKRKPIAKTLNDKKKLLNPLKDNAKQEITIKKKRIKAGGARFQKNDKNDSIVNIKKNNEQAKRKVSKLKSSKGVKNDDNRQKKSKVDETLTSVKMRKNIGKKSTDKKAYRKKKKLAMKKTVKNTFAIGEEIDRTKVRVENGIQEHEAKQSKFGTDVNKQIHRLRKLLTAKDPGNYFIANFNIFCALLVFFLFPGDSITLNDLINSSSMMRQQEKQIDKYVHDVYEKFIKRYPTPVIQIKNRMIQSVNKFEHHEDEITPKKDYQLAKKVQLYMDNVKLWSESEFKDDELLSVEDYAEIDSTMDLHDNLHPSDEIIDGKQLIVTREDNKFRSPKTSVQPKNANAIDSTFDDTSHPFERIHDWLMNEEFDMQSINDDICVQSGKNILHVRKYHLLEKVLQLFDNTQSHSIDSSLLTESIEPSNHCQIFSGQLISVPNEYFPLKLLLRRANKMYIPLNMSLSEQRKWGCIVDDNIKNQYDAIMVPKVLILHDISLNWNSSIFSQHFQKIKNSTESTCIIIYYLLNEDYNFVLSMDPLMLGYFHKEAILSLQSKLSKPRVLQTAQTVDLFEAFFDLLKIDISYEVPSLKWIKQCLPTLLPLYSKWFELLAPFPSFPEGICQYDCKLILLYIWRNLLPNVFASNPVKNLVCENLNHPHFYVFDLVEKIRIESVTELDQYISPSLRMNKSVQTNPLKEHLDYSNNALCTSDATELSDYDGDNCSLDDNFNNNWSSNETPPNSVINAYNIQPELREEAIGQQITKDISVVWKRMERALNTASEFVTATNDISVSYYQSQSDENNVIELKYDYCLMLYGISGNSSITFVNSHPIMKELIVAAFATNDKMFTKSYIGIWSLDNYVKPKIILECKEDVIVFEFCPTQPFLIAGGCANGSVVLWDLDQYSSKFKTGELACEHMSSESKSVSEFQKSSLKSEEAIVYKNNNNRQAYKVNLLKDLGFGDEMFEKYAFLLKKHDFIDDNIDTDEFEDEFNRFNESCLKMSNISTCKIQQYYQNYICQKKNKFKREFNSNDVRKVCMYKDTDDFSSLLVSEKQGAEMIAKIEQGLKNTMSKYQTNFFAYKNKMHTDDTNEHKSNLSVLKAQTDNSIPVNISVVPPSCCKGLRFDNSMDPITKLTWLPSDIEINKRGLPTNPASPKSSYPYFMTFSKYNLLQFWSTNPELAPPRKYPVIANYDLGININEQELYSNQKYNNLDKNWTPVYKLSTQSVSNENTTRKFAITGYCPYFHKSAKLSVKGHNRIDTTVENLSLSNTVDQTADESGQGVELDDEATIVNTSLLLHNKNGNVLCVDWRALKTNDTGQSDIQRLYWRKKIARAPIIVMEESPFFQGLFVVATELENIVCIEKNEIEPIINRISNESIVDAKWSTTNRYIYFLSHSSGYLTVWSLDAKLTEAVYRYRVSQTSLTSFNQHYFGSKEYLAVGDSAGFLHLLEVTWSSKQLLSEDTLDLISNLDEEESTDNIENMENNKRFQSKKTVLNEELKQHLNNVQLKTAEINKMYRMLETDEAASMEKLQDIDSSFGLRKSMQYVEEQETQKRSTISTQSSYEMH
ncbi:hypothetical protein GJ496_011229 [Pomphorhynchus laevis]|nr:hypothetical protein GJ496_011229 [Pomphorhynchus laevis]